MLHLPLNIITYPRSGLNLFRSLLEQQYYSSHASHSISEFKNSLSIVTIARNPVDSVASHFAMTSFDRGNEPYEIIEQFLVQYAEQYAWFLENSAYVVSYDNLIENPKPEMERFFKHFDLSYSQIDYDLTLIKDAIKGYLKTATRVSFYDKAKTHVLESDALHRAQEAYHKLLFFRWVQGY